MEKIILGLLMMRRLTVYEIRGLISKNFKAMCSDSLGGIQAAMKRLLESGKVTCSEFVEKGVNKKQYAITDKGRDEFKAWVNTPAAISNPKNMELGKLLFMGLVPRGDRKVLIDESIALLNQEMDYLMEIYDGISCMDTEQQLAAAVNHYQNDPEYGDGMIAAAGCADLAQLCWECYYYERITLQYGIEATRFQIDWLTRMKEKAGAEEEGGR